MEKFKFAAGAQLVIILALVFTIMFLSAKLEYISTLDEDRDAVNHVTIEKTIFGYMPTTREEVYKYKLKNEMNGFEVNLISYGAAIQSLFVKDRADKQVNVALGFNRLEEYMDKNLNPYFGGIVGRVANRISNAEFKLGNRVYKLDKNEPNRTLHGGRESFIWKNWESSELRSGNGVRFSLTSPAGSGGFPGKVDVTVVYKLDSRTNSLTIEYTGKTSEPTPLDLTNHLYFNLEGHNSRKKIYDHQMRIYSNYYLETEDISMVTTGRLKPTASTRNDFREFTRLEELIDKNVVMPGISLFNTYFVADQQTGRKMVASVKTPSNGIQLDVWSNQNGVQLYTGDYLDVVKPSIKDNYSYHEGFCLLTHNFPDAVNKPQFPSSIVRPEASYHQLTTFKFSISDE